MSVLADLQAVIEVISTESSPPLLVEAVKTAMKRHFGYSTNTGRRGENEVMDKYYDPFVTRTGLYFIATDRCDLVDPNSWGGMAENQDYRDACPPRNTPRAAAAYRWPLIEELKHADERIREWEEANPLTNGVH
jgi:hypothetical protein